VGQSALARGTFAEAEDQLRASLGLLDEMGAALEAARTRLALDETLVASAGTADVPHEARTLLAEAHAQFVASGATLDQARSDQLATVWDSR